MYSHPTSYVQGNLPPLTWRPGEWAWCSARQGQRCRAWRQCAGTWNPHDPELTL